jgi:Tol biopolymer transport system component
MEQSVRDLLRDISNDIPPQRQVPPPLRGRARRRIAATVGVTVVVVGALALGGVVAVRSITASSPRPANPGPTTEPTPLGSGEVLTVRKGHLVAKDPASGEVRTIVDAVDAKALSGQGTPRGVTGAAWSPDRRWVAFRAGGLWLADSMGGAPRQLTPDLGWNPWAWSPTGDQLVVVLGRDVTLIDAATGRETDLGTTVGAEDIDGYAVHSLVWSPDGTRIAYDGGPVLGPGGGDAAWLYDGGGSVYSIDVESGEQTLLVRQPADTGEIKDIDWSPDGAHLAITYVDASYIASHKAELGPAWPWAKALYLANADGSDLRLLDRIVASQWPVWHPGLSVGTAWSPDGSRLAYTSFSGPDHRELQVWTVSVDGSAPSLVASRCCLANGGGPVWSPDGSQIAFVTDEGGLLQHRHLVVNADGTGDLRGIDELTYLSWGGGWYFCACYG